MTPYVFCAFKPKGCVCMCVYLYRIIFHLHVKLSDFIYFKHYYRENNNFNYKYHIIWKLCYNSISLFWMSFLIRLLRVVKSAICMLLKTFQHCLYSWNNKRTEIYSKYKIVYRYTKSFQIEWPVAWGGRERKVSWR